MTIIQGPPGTGKTRVLGMIATNCVEEARPFLLIAETFYAVAVCVKRICEDLKKVGDDLEGVWLTVGQGMETADLTTTTNDSSRICPSEHRRNARDHPARRRMLLRSCSTIDIGGKLNRMSEGDCKL